MSNNRHIADYGITEDAFIELLKGFDGRTRFRLRGLPADARPMGVHHDWLSRTFWVRVESAEHEPTREGDHVERREWKIEREEIPGPLVTGLLDKIRARDREYGDVLYYHSSESSVVDRREVLKALDASQADNVALRAEIASLRAIFAADYMNDSVVAREAWAQGWRDCQRQREMAGKADRFGLSGLDVSTSAVTANAAVSQMTLMANQGLDWEVELQQNASTAALAAAIAFVQQHDGPKD